MRLSVLRHHGEDEPGLLAAAFATAGFELELHDGAGTGPLPDPEATDAVVVLGSVWSVYDRSAVGGWIDAELDWLRDLDRRGVAVLGVCFGARTCLPHLRARWGRGGLVMDVFVAGVVGPRCQPRRMASPGSGLRARPAR